MEKWQKVKTKIYSNIGNITSGIYSDDYWKAPHTLIKIIGNVCEAYDYELDIVSSRYEKNSEDNPIRKIWIMKITDPNGKERLFRMVAHGAGSVNDPLDRYDVTVGIT